MTSKEAKEYLQQIEKMSVEVKQLKEKRLTVEYSLLPGAIDYSKDKVQSSPTDPMLNAAVRMDELTQKINQLIVSREELIYQIIEEVNTLPDVKHREILYKRYVQGKTLHTISREMNYQYKWICKLHGFALNGFAKQHDQRRLL